MEIVNKEIEIYSKNQHVLGNLSDLEGKRWRCSNIKVSSGDFIDYQSIVPNREITTSNRFAKKGF
jgi:hypothetical protein